MNNTNNKVTCKSATAMFVWPLIVKAKYQIIKSGLHAKFESMYKHQHYLYRPWLFWPLIVKAMKQIINGGQ